MVGKDIIAEIEDLNDLIEKDPMGKYVREIIKEIERVSPREAEVFLKEPEDYKAEYKPFVQRIVMLIIIFGADETTYNPEHNSIEFWWD